MPDGWDIDYSFNPLLAFDALLDADTDGLSKLGEYQVGTYHLSVSFLNWTTSL